MVAFNFKPEFVDKIKSGDKRQTVRKTKRCNIGDAIQLYTGQRTKDCIKIADAECCGIIEVSFFIENIRGNLRRVLHRSNPVNGMFEQLIEGITDPEGEEIHAFARADGFANSTDMFWFFEKQYGLPFNGVLHKWILK